MVKSMNTLDKFISFLCGDFNNEKQIKEKQELGQQDFPKASHINRVCNQKIIHLPADFKGYFVIEESYYQIGERTNILPHLFLFTLNEAGKVVLTSYELPEGIRKEEFKSNNPELIIDYRQLKLSEKFTPMIYEETEEAFKGKSISNFGNGLIFTLEETTSEGHLIVHEVFERNGKRTFGFDEPIVYVKVK